MNFLKINYKIIKKIVPILKWPYICISQSTKTKKLMKKVIILFVLIMCGMMSQPTQAQISFQANIGLQPLWGPIGYDHVEYYYLPDVDAYYYVPTHMFFYMENGRWVNRPYLSGRYRNFDLFSARKYVINEDRPYLRHNQFRSRYLNARDYRRPMAIRDSHDSRYFEISGHPEHSKWRGNVVVNHGPQNMGRDINRNQNMNRNQEVNRNQNMNRNQEVNRNQNQNVNRNQNQNVNRNQNTNQNQNVNRNQNTNQTKPQTQPQTPVKTQPTGKPQPQNNQNTKRENPTR